MENTQINVVAEFKNTERHSKAIVSEVLIGGWLTKSFIVVLWDNFGVLPCRESFPTEALAIAKAKFLVA